MFITRESFLQSGLAIGATETLHSWVGITPWSFPPGIHFQEVGMVDAHHLSTTFEWFETWDASTKWSVVKESTTSEWIGVLAGVECHFLAVSNLTSGIWDSGPHHFFMTAEHCCARSLTASNFIFLTTAPWLWWAASWYHLGIFGALCATHHYLVFTTFEFFDLVYLLDLIWVLWRIIHFLKIYELKFINYKNIKIISIINEPWLRLIYG